MMQPEHELYCDEEHPPRQQCNDALAPPGVRAARMQAEDVSEGEPQAPADTLVPEEPAWSAQRDAVTETEMPEPTVYAAREWERTEAAVGRGDQQDAVPADARSGGSGLRRAAMVAAAIAVVLVTVRGVRGRRGERQ